MNLYAITREIFPQRGLPKCLAEVGAYSPQRSQLRGFLYRQQYERVILIEPQPSCAQLLRDAFSHYPGVQIIQAAISSHKGTVAMYCCGEGTFLKEMASPAVMAFG